MKLKQRTKTCGLAVALGFTGCDSGRDVVVAELDGEVNTDAQAGAGDSGSADADGAVRDGDSASCAWVDAVPKHVPATMWLVIEHSTPLFRAPTPDVAPWDRLAATLLGPEGLIPKYESTFRFGAVFHGSDPTAASCPALTTLAPAPNNASALETLAQSLMSEPSTPIGGYALGYVAEAPRPSEGNVVVVMARQGRGGSDGACSKDIPVGADQYGETMAYEAARKLVASGAPLFVVEFSRSTTASEASATLAAIGSTGSGPFFVPTRSSASGKDQLEGVFRTILDQSVSCEFQLNGEVDVADACRGEVSVDGVARACNDPNGWRMKGTGAIELVGSSCADLRASADTQVRARFPCDVIVLF